eukprot:760126-Hanusia_phi.AAC.1
MNKKEKKLHETLMFLVAVTSAAAYYLMWSGFGVVKKTDSAGKERLVFFAHFIERLFTTPVPRCFLRYVGSCIPTAPPVLHLRSHERGQGRDRDDPGPRRAHGAIEHHWSDTAPPMEVVLVDCVCCLLGAVGSASVVPVQQGERVWQLLLGGTAGAGRHPPRLLHGLPHRLGAGRGRA